MKSYSVAWFEGNGPLKPGIPAGTLPELQSEVFETEDAARRHANYLIQSGRHSVTLRGPNGLVLRENELEPPAALI